MYTVPLVKVCLCSTWRNIVRADYSASGIRTVSSRGPEATYSVTSRNTHFTQLKHPSKKFLYKNSVINIQN